MGGVLGIPAGGKHASQGTFSSLKLPKVDFLGPDRILYTFSINNSLHTG